MSERAHMYIWMYSYMYVCEYVAVYSCMHVCVCIDVYTYPKSLEILFPDRKQANYKESRQTNEATRNQPT